MQFDNETLLSALEAQFPGAILSHSDPYGMLTLETTREQIIDLLRFLKEDPKFQFNFLTTMSTVHFPNDAGRELSMVYHIHSWVNNFRLRIKIFFPSADPHVPTATVIWPAANWMERQEYDFFGVIFDGHPDLRRILNVDDLDVFPLRKEFRLEDGTRTDKDDRFFGRDGHVGVSFE